MAHRGGHQGPVKGTITDTERPSFASTPGPTTPTTSCSGATSFQCRLARQQVENQRACQERSPQHHSRESNTGFNASTHGPLSFGEGKPKVGRTEKSAQGKEGQRHTEERPSNTELPPKELGGQTVGQEALTTATASPGYDALDVKRSNWILILGFGPLQSDEPGVSVFGRQVRLSSPWFLLVSTGLHAFVLLRLVGLTPGLTLGRTRSA